MYLAYLLSVLATNCHYLWLSVIKMGHINIDITILYETASMIFKTTEFTAGFFMSIINFL